MTVFDSCRPVYQAIQPRHRHACGYRLANDGVRLDAEIGRIEAPLALDLGGGAAQAEFSAAHDMDAVGKALARSRPTLATATFRTPRLHRAGARPVQGVLSRLITRTRISSAVKAAASASRSSIARGSIRMTISSQVNANRRYSVRSAALPALRARPIHKSACSRHSCGDSTIHSKLSNNRSGSKHGARLSAAATKPISARR